MRGSRFPTSYANLTHFANTSLHETCNLRSCRHREVARPGSSMAMEITTFNVQRGRSDIMLLKRALRLARACNKLTYDINTVPHRGGIISSQITLIAPASRKCLVAIIPQVPDNNKSVLEHGARLISARICRPFMYFAHAVCHL